MRSDVCDHSFDPIRPCFVVEMAGGVEMTSNVSCLEGNLNGFVFALAIPDGFADLTDLCLGSVGPCLIDSRLGAYLHEVLISKKEGLGGPEDAVPSLGMRKKVVRQASGDDFHELAFLVPRCKETHGKAASLREGGEPYAGSA